MDSFLDEKIDLIIYFSFYREKFGLFEGARLSLQKLQLFLVKEIQDVYESQGVIVSHCSGLPFGIVMEAN